MIPPFDETGDLPPGLHSATWDEFRTHFCRFTQSDRRLMLCQHLEQLVEDARVSNIVTRILIGGSMVRATAEPNDFDCIVALHAETQYEALRPTNSRSRMQELHEVDTLETSSWLGKDSMRFFCILTSFCAIEMARLLAWLR